MQDVLNFIDGRQVPAASGEWLDDVDPATGATHARLASSDARDVDRAVAAALRAFPAWSATPAVERSKLMRRLARLIERDLDSLARAESIDSGKPLSAARTVDIPRAVQNFDFFADAITQFSSEAHPTDEVALNYTLRQPLGAVACISPWNLPLYLLSWKTAPALAAGNCVVAKPSEVTPMTAHLLGALAAEAGFPPGVLNVVQGLGPKAGAPLCAHREIRAISFTGSTRVGGEIGREAAGSFKKVSLEMGGKNPTVIFADADLREAIPQTVRAAFSNTGQICLCGSRILVEKSAYGLVRDELVERVRALEVGDPLDPATEQGALVSRQHLDKVLGCLAVAKQEGGRVLCGGGRAVVPGRCAGGFFVQPTLIEGLAPPAAPTRRRSSVRWRRCFHSRPRRRRSRSRTRHAMVSPLRCGLAICRGPIASPPSFRAGSSGSTAGCCATCARRSEASRSRASAAKAGWTRCGSSPKRRTSA